MTSDEFSMVNENLEMISSITCYLCSGNVVAFTDIVELARDETSEYNFIMHKKDGHVVVTTVRDKAIEVLDVEFRKDLEKGDTDDRDNQ